jgi:hypothetical protein
MINISRATAKGLFTAETQRAQRQRGEEREFLRLGCERVSTNRALLFHHYRGEEVIKLFHLFILYT